MTEFKRSDLVSVEWNSFRWRIKEIFIHKGRARATLQYVFPFYFEVSPARQIIELHGSRQAKYTNDWFLGNKIAGTNILFNWQNRLKIFKPTWSKGLRMDRKANNERKRVFCSAWLDDLSLIESANA